MSPPTPPPAMSEAAAEALLAALLELHAALPDLERRDRVLPAGRSPDRADGLAATGSSTGTSVRPPPVHPASTIGDGLAVRGDGAAAMAPVRARRAAMLRHPAEGGLLPENSVLVDRLDRYARIGVDGLERTGGPTGGRSRAAGGEVPGRCP